MTAHPSSLTRAAAAAFVVAVAIGGPAAAAQAAPSEPWPVTAPEGAAALWIDLESPSLSDASVAVWVDGDGGSVAVPLRTTAFGRGAIVEIEPGVLSVTVDVPEGTDVALTVESVDGAVLWSDVRRAGADGIVVPVDPTDPDPGSPPQNPGGPSSSTAAVVSGSGDGGSKGDLAVTGLSVAGIAVGSAAALALGSAALIARRRAKGETR